MTWTTDELLTVEEAADVLGVGVQRMYNLRNLGQGPVSYRRGRRLVYPRSGLAAFLVRELQATLKSGEGVCEYPQADANGRG
jgi:Helix-turn-helix domain